MIRQSFDIEGYWDIIIYYNIDYTYFNEIVMDLKSIGSTKYQIQKIHYNMKYGMAKAVTCSSCHYKKSVLLFNNHASWIDFVNSIIHESEHIKQAMLKCYNIDDYGEPPAYTIGYIAAKILSKATKRRDITPSLIALNCLN